MNHCQNARQYLIGHRVGSELAAYITAGKGGMISYGISCSRKPVPGMVAGRYDLHGVPLQKVLRQPGLASALSPSGRSSDSGSSRRNAFPDNPVASYSDDPPLQRWARCGVSPHSRFSCLHRHPRTKNYTPDSTGAEILSWARS